MDIKLFVYKIKIKKLINIFNKYNFKIIKNK